MPCRFTIKSVHNGPKATAARYALSELLEKSRVEGAVSGDAARAMKDAMRKLIYRRRRLLEGLRGLGWAPLQDDLACEYMMNCPPHGVTTDKADLKTCKRTHICPFCWCREYVAPIYDKLDAVLYPHGQTPAALELVAINTRRRYSRKLFPTLETPFSWLAHARNNLIKRVLPGRVGVAQLCSIEASDEEWTIVHRVLALMPRQADEDRYRVPTGVPREGLRLERSLTRVVLPHGGGEKEIKEGRRRLAPIVGRFAIFPAVMLNGDEQDILTILTRLEKYRFRLFSVSGILRGRSPAPTSEVAEEELG